MRLIRRILPLALLVAACAPGAELPDPSTLDAVAQRYVVLVLQLGHHDANYVDAWYGPDSLKLLADRDTLSVNAIQASADSLVAVLGETTPEYADTLVRLRHSYLHTQLQALASRAAMVNGEKFTFDVEAKRLYDATPPTFSDAHFDSLVAQLDGLLPGTGSLAARYASFREGVMIPAAKVDTVFRVAIAACRARTAAHMTLPPGEGFTVEYLTGTTWNAYNWYKGKYQSLIQVNLDFPIAIERAVDLACHEGYPGHHVYNARLEEILVNGRGWVEFSVYPLYSPQSLIAEGSANFGIDMAFPGEERTAYERDSLFPLAGLDPALAERNASVRHVMEALNYARNEVARRYLDGGIDSSAAIGLIQRWWLQSPEAAAKTLRFIQGNGSYVINYNLGRDLVAAWVERQGGSDPAARWAAFNALLSSPRLPADLQ
jgi:hypothetical protein